LRSGISIIRMDMKEIITLTLLWVCVPGVYAAMFVFALLIIARTVSGEQRTSAKAGIWAGIIALVAYMIAKVDIFREPLFTQTILPPMDYAAAGIGFAAGFLIIGIVRFLVPTRLVGAVVLLLVAASTIGLYSYVFIESMRPALLYITLGFGFGAFAHIIVIPASLRGLWT